MSLRVDVSELPGDVIAALERGETVEVERDGEVVASFAMPPVVTDWERYVALRRAAPPLGYDDFLEDLEKVRTWFNSPNESPEWPS